jgi:hypothetical protein
MDTSSALSSAFIFLGVVFIVIAAIISARRKRLVTVLDKPPLEPRFPRMVDAWSAVIPRLGGQHDKIRSRLFHAVSDRPVERMQSSLETYAYFGADGYIEREQLVIRLGQALVHLHVYDFEAELFVGWDANLNQVRWIETAPQAHKIQEGKLNQFCSLQSGWHVANEYDVVDLSVITELVHRRLKDELQKIMKERSIEDEIDFTIVRGQRDGLVVKKQEDSQAGNTGGVFARAARRFQRQ